MGNGRISEIIGLDYKNWNKDNLIFIKSGTGTGKSYFVKNILNTYAKENKQNILYLTNRINLNRQVSNDIGMDSNITVLNYQKLEFNILNDVQNIKYDYVVMDEAQYFFVDASFSINTDVFFKEMLSDKSVCKIIMTATPILLTYYFKINNIKVDYEYELKTNYDYIANVTAFNKDECIENIIESIPENEQIIYFGTAKRALGLSRKFSGAFICSQYNKHYSNYVNQDELNNIIENSEFKSHLLCTTTALDNGINIKEGTPVGHIIIDIFDRDTFIQCLGRKRVGEGEKVNLYFNSFSNKRRINGFKKKLSDGLQRADFLIEEGEKEYINKNYKAKINGTRLIDEKWNDSKDKSEKVVNECIYTKYYVDLVICNSILNKEFPNSYKNIIAIGLGINKDDIIDMDVKIQIQTIENLLESVAGKRLFKEEQKEVIEFIGLKANGKLLKGYQTFNAYFKERNIPYIIDVPKRKSYRDENGKPKKEKTYWIVNKMTY